MVSTNLNRVGGFALMLDFGVFKLGEGPMAASFGGKAMWGVLGDLERELKEGPEGGYFMGEHPGRADILAEYPVTLVKHRNWADLKADYPLLDAWLERVHARDAFKRSLQKGNGYDLTIFPKVPGRL